MSKRTYFLLVAFIFHAPAFSKPIDQEAKLWSETTFQGTFKADSPWRYSVQNSLRLRSKGNAFEEDLARLALGYRLAEKTSFWLGYDLRQTNLGKGFLREQRAWEQWAQNLISEDHWVLDSRLRWEQRFRQHESKAAHRLRERILAKFSLFGSNKFNGVLYEEVFFNLNHPDWVTRYAVDQNRAYAGIELAPPGSKAALTLGYMNQFLFRHVRNVMNHVVLLSLTFDL